LRNRLGRHGGLANFELPVPEEQAEALHVEDKLPQGRRTAVRFGWNDAAWGQPRRHVDAELAACYERGYVAGLIFRKSSPTDLAVQVCQDIQVAEPRGLPASQLSCLGGE
jgi:hypothetical protein